jgi:ABC-type lipoprotein export system ATPase subunit
MFRQAYQGEAAEHFRRGLDVYRAIYDPDVHFGHWVSILQSSGTGKSRLVKELGNLVQTDFISSLGCID